MIYSQGIYLVLKSKESVAESIWMTVIEVIELTDTKFKVFVYVKKDWVKIGVEMVRK